MKKYGRNIRVFAENNGEKDGFNIYLDFSGQKEYVYTHRHHFALYNALTDGIFLADLQRGVQKKQYHAIYGRKHGITVMREIREQMQYMLVVLDEYINSRNGDADNHEQAV